MSASLVFQVERWGQEVHVQVFGGDGRTHWSRDRRGTLDMSAAQWDLLRDALDAARLQAGAAIEVQELDLTPQETT